MRDMGYRMGRIGLSRPGAALVTVAPAATLTTVVNLDAKPAVTGATASRSVTTGPESPGPTTRNLR